MRVMPDSRARLRSVIFSPVEESSDAAIASIYFEFNCRDETNRVLAAATYDVKCTFLNDEIVPS